jgi:homopolymeric O-antigen transport system permease protein
VIGVPPRHELTPFTVDVPRPGMRGHALRLREVLGARELLTFLAWRDLTVRYKQSAIGVFWAVLQPLLLAGVFTLFLGKLGRLDSGDTSYALATFVALLPWQLAAFAVFAASHSVVSSQDLVKRVYFPRILIPLAPFAVALVDFGAAFAVALVWLVVASPPLTLTVMWVPAFLLLALVTAVGVGCWLAALNVRFRDVQVAVPVLVQLWFFCTPVAYPSNIVPARWQLAYAANPMVTAVDGFRAALLGAPNLHPGAVLLSVAVALVLAVTGIWFFWRTEDAFADIV